MQTVTATLQAYFEALNRSDVDAVLAVFAADGSLLAEGSPTATGRDQLRRAYEATFQSIGLQREMQVDRIREGSDVAVASTHTSGTITTWATDTTTNAISRELFVLRRTGTDWQITDYMFNRPEPS